MLAPFSFAFGECEVRHEMVGRGAVPVPLAGWGDDDVASSDADEWSAAGLDEAFTFGHAEGLTERMPVPGRVGAWGEVHPPQRDGGWALALGNRVDVDIAGEPVGWSLERGLSLYELHRAHGTTTSRRTGVPASTPLDAASLARSTAG